MPPEPPPAPLRLIVDTQALADNWRALNALSGSASAGAAVKADAYGLGAATVVPQLWQAGCRDFFVAHWSEVVPLLPRVPAGSLAVLHGPISAAEAAYATLAKVRPVINSLHQARLWLAAGGGACDMMVDTGMNRIGLALADLGDPVIGNLQVDTLLSHLASADADSALNALQCQRWNEARAAVPHRRASLANSAGITLGAAYHGDLTRPGVALYGGVPCAALDGVVRQVAHPQTALLQVRSVKAGDSVGYNETFVAERAMRIGVVSLGYADGYLRCWSGKGAMTSHGRRLPVIGRVSMDMTAIDLGAAPDLAEGDWVDVDYALPQASAISGLSQYELLTTLGRRFPR